MHKLFNIVLKGTLALSLLFSVPCFGQGSFNNFSNFLPMEDVLSAARNNSEFYANNVKPYRQSFNLGSQTLQNNSYVDFTTTDIVAFILLAGIYLTFVRRNSKSRNASF